MEIACTVVFIAVDDFLEQRMSSSQSASFCVFILKFPKDLEAGEGGNLWQVFCPFLLPLQSWMPRFWYWYSASSASIAPQSMKPKSSQCHHHCMHGALLGFQCLDWRFSLSKAVGCPRTERSGARQQVRGVIVSFRWKKTVHYLIKVLRGRVVVVVDRLEVYFPGAGRADLSHFKVDRKREKRLCEIYSKSWSHITCIIHLLLPPPLVFSRHP